jgi:hypothetical protein
MLDPPPTPHFGCRISDFSPTHPGGTADHADQRRFRVSTHPPVSPPRHQGFTEYSFDLYPEEAMETPAPAMNTFSPPKFSTRGRGGGGRRKFRRVGGRGEGAGYIAMVMGSRRTEPAGAPQAREGASRRDRRTLVFGGDGASDRGCDRRSQRAGIRARRRTRARVGVMNDTNWGENRRQF